MEILKRTDLAELRSWLDWLRHNSPGPQRTPIREVFREGFYRGATWAAHAPVPATEHLLGSLEAACSLLSIAVDLIPAEFRPAYRLAAAKIIERLAEYRDDPGAGQGG